jgi:hypothetical protein
VIGYCFLGEGAVGLDGCAWPIPVAGAPGAWVAGDHARACLVGELPYWIDDELWIVELTGDIEQTGHLRRGTAGRLLAEVVTWDATTADAFVESALNRIRDVAVAALRDGGWPTVAQRLSAIDARDAGACGRLASEAAVVAGAVDELAADAPLALAETIGFLSDVEDCRGPRAGLAGYCAAHAVGRAGADYDAGFAAERARQACWLASRLGLGRHR